MRTLNTFATVCIGLSALLLSGQASTQDITIEYAGEVTTSTRPLPVTPERVRAKVVLASSQQAYNTVRDDIYGLLKEYKDAVVSWEFEVLDANGEVIDMPVTTRYFVRDYPFMGFDSEGPYATSRFIYKEEYFNYFTFDGGDATDVRAESDFSFILQSRPGSALLSGIEEFPVFNDLSSSEQPVDLYSRFSVRQPEGEVFLMMNVDTYEISFIADADSDGVADADDACPTSQEADSVMFGEVDSGVANAFDAEGCSIMDRYAACNADEEQERSFSRRSFWRYAGPSYCEKQVAYDLVRDGMIDYQAARQLRDALYTSHR